MKVEARACFQSQTPMLNLQAKRRSEFLKGDQDLLDGLFGGSSETVPPPPRANIWTPRTSYRGTYVLNFGVRSRLVVHRKTSSRRLDRKGT